MKKTNKINLNQLAIKEVDMKKSEMKAVRGGNQPDQCICVCVLPSAPTANYPRETSSNSAS
jgi:natural product precursor